MKSILGKLWLGITSLVIIIILMIWVFQVFLLNTFYIGERSRLLQSEGKRIASLFEQSDNILDIHEEIISEIENFRYSFDVNIILVSTTLEPLIERESIKSIFARIPIITDPQAVKSIKEGKPFSKRKKIPKLDNTYLIAGIPLKNKDKLIGSVVLYTSVEPIHETTTILKRQLTIITLMSVAIGTILSLLLAKAFTKPIIKIIHAAKKITKGDFEAKVYIKSKDEIGVLGDAINDLSTQLGQTEKFRKEFIANTTHEFKTPISLIKAYAELMMEVDDEQKENINKYLNVIIEESDRLNNMVEDMLYLSKMEAGYYKLNMKSFNLVEVAQNVIEKLSCLADENNIQISLDTSSKKIALTADEDEIQHVLLNLVNNAILHSTTGDMIILKIFAHKTGVRVEITDNGVGIPSEDLPHIWDRFYKVDKSRKRESSGTGLGMSIVKSILEAHNFKYGIESYIGEGTTVWFESRDE